MNACDYSGAEIKSFNNDGGSFRDWKAPLLSYIEARVKIAECGGVGSAFWLYGAAPGRFYEIDVFEHDSRNPQKIKSNVHYGPDYVRENVNPSSVDICDMEGDEINMSDEFLTFGLELDFLVARLYLNGVQINTYVFNGFLPTNPYNLPVPFNIRLSAGGNPHGGDPSECNDLPDYFKIDYVRVYQKAGSRAVNFVENTDKITLCADNVCHGSYAYCKYVKVNYSRREMVLPGKNLE